MPVNTVEALIAALGRHHLLPPDQLHQVAQVLRPQHPEVNALAGELVRRGWLTAYTADMLLGRLKPPTHAELQARLTEGDADPSGRQSIARQLGVFVLVSLLIGLGLHLLLAVPPGWAAFWGFVLYRVVWDPSDLVEQSCSGCGCVFLTLTAVATFVLNWPVGQPFVDALGWGLLPGLAVVVVVFGPIFVAATREDNRLHRRLRSIPSLSPDAARAQVEWVMTNPEMCRCTPAAAEEGVPGPALGPLLRDFFDRYRRVEFLMPGGHVPDDLRFDRDAVRPSIYLVGYVQLNHYDWVFHETAVKPDDDTIYVIDAQKRRGGGPVLREREVPEVTATYPSIYHFILDRLVFSGHPHAAQVPA